MIGIQPFDHVRQSGGTAYPVYDGRKGRVARREWGSVGRGVGVDRPNHVDALPGLDADAARMHGFAFI